MELGPSQLWQKKALHSSGRLWTLGRVVGRFPKSNLRVALDDTGTMNTV
ncbi:hypothetical protein SM0020_33813 [Sinorhizobium meliloti CCNWSX0020]|uniref:Uncharacterized protein n=1 Tax=Sinorhizobium meliloti CCNWSX0020 TaxID=1107881 RepID=H0GB50_RHIML|nr:hypothetical protein SM0020_33813 [Sinorhizobium meliloti CCNWSX0020]GEC42055.1 hypothetical protein EME01_61270 [Sinorhizobium meliloti]